MGPGARVIKWLMCFFNIIFWITGIVLIVAGAIVQTQYKPYLAFLGNNNYFEAPVLVIVIGAVITITAFFGCCGSAKENYCMLMTFSVILISIFLIVLAGGILGYVERGRVAGYIRENMKTSVGKYNATSDVVWTTLQTQQHCCGVDNYEDWRNATAVPTSCCKSQADPTCGPQLANFPMLARECSSTASPSATPCPIYTEGCYESLSRLLEQSVGIVGGVALGAAGVQLFGIIFSCFLAHRVKQGYTYA